LISSIPLNHFCEISDLKETTDHSVFSFNQVLVFNLGFDLRSIDKTIHWRYVPSKDINFYRVGFYNNIIGSEKLSLYIEIGYSKNAIISQEEIQSQLQTTLDGLRKIGIIDQHKLVDYQAIIMNPAYVHITKQSIHETTRIRTMLEERDAYIIGRYGDWKYCSIEDCMIDSVKTYKKINNLE
jgi:protoporphyrinogen oxidase